MFKRLLVLFCLLLLVLPSYAAIYLVEPADKTVLQNEELFFGKIAKGETLKIVIKKKSDLSLEWSELTVDRQLLPSGWKVESIQSDKTLIAAVTVAVNAPISTQRIRLTASNPAEPAFSESFYATVSVQENLLSASVENLNQAAVLGEKAVFKLIASNDSIAEHRLKVESSLPGYWFEEQGVLVKPHDTMAVELPVYPRTYGEKNFSFTVSSLQNSKQFTFPAKLDVKPTLAGLYQAPIAGFPFFSPGMLPYFLINGLLSLIS